MKDLEVVILKRDVEATQIPEAQPHVLRKGDTVTITQQLGGSFTVQTYDLRKFRVEGADADALGKEPPAGTVLAHDPDEELSEQEVKERAWDVLRTVHDPEIPLNIVDLGLVYELELHQRGDGKYLAVVRMTLTAPGCGMGDFLIADVERGLKAVPGIDTVDAKIVFDPIWNPYVHMTEAARLQLGML